MGAPGKKEVGEVGLEPTNDSDFKSDAYADSATRP